METKIEVYYSTNEEEFTYSEINDALECLWDESPLDTETLTIWQGDCHHHPASFFFPDALKHMADRAYDEYSEYCGDWPDLKSEDCKELQGRLEKVVDDFFTEKDSHPRFGLVNNTKALEFRIVRQAKYFSDVILEPIAK